MKKLSVLVALMLIITVGGVYATWTYAQAIGAVANKQVEVHVKLADIAYTVDMNSTKGTIYASVSDDFSLEIDQKDATYDAKWVTDGDITVTFTHAPNATEEVQNNGIIMHFSLSGTLPTGVVINTDPITLNNGQPTKLVKISAADIANAISLDGVNLPTEASYDAFMSALGNGDITITISEGIGGNGEGEGDPGL